MSSPLALLSPKDVEALHARVFEFESFTPRELQIYLAGQEDGKNIKADEIAPRMAELEFALENHGVLFLS